MATPEERELVEEAKEIFLRLLEDPRDGGALRDKTAFLARGKSEQIAWNRVSRVWNARNGIQRPQRLFLLPFLLLLSAGLFAAFFADDLRTRLIADAASSFAPEAVLLASGDRAHLDAGSALIDDTEKSERRVALLDGAVFVQPAPDATRPFVVTAGPLTARAIGTAFEVTKSGDDVTLAVLEGIVEARIGTRAERLGPGDRLRWGSKSGRVLDKVELGSIAAWREDRLLADRLGLAEALSIIDRRLPGRIVLIGEGSASISGTFDLTQPLAALRAMASVEGAQVFAAPPIVTVVVVP
ncbi:MAG: FecR domain-containing protein [Pseudomonadota bacterium]